MAFFLERKPLVLPVFCRTVWTGGTWKDSTLSYLLPDHAVGLWQIAVSFFQAVCNEKQETEGVSIEQKLFFKDGPMELKRYPIIRSGTNTVENMRTSYLLLLDSWEGEKTKTTVPCQ